MALKASSMFLYGLQVTPNNRSIDFKSSAMGPELRASLTLGYYSLTDLMAEIATQLHAADPHRVYTVTADRTFANGTQNRVTITTNGTFLSLLFASGSRSASTAAPLIGFSPVDQTGATTYTGTGSAGTVLVPTLTGYNYLSTDHNKKVFGSLNISTTGQKEAIVFQVQEFFQVQFKFEPSVKVTNEWVGLMVWMIQQRPLEFTPEITNPIAFYVCTLEKSSEDGKGLGYKFKEMLPDFPTLFDTNVMTFRKKVST